MDRNKEKKQMPLFYVHQPSIKFPKISMQERYAFKEEEDLVVQETSMNQEENDLSKQDKQVVTTTSQEKKKPPFNSLPLDEKIRHLKIVPASVAKVRYEFITQNQNFKGYFLEMKDNFLIIYSTSPKKKAVSISMEDLLDIKRIGL